MNLIFMLIDKVQCFENVTLILLIVYNMKYMYEMWHGA